MQMLQNRRKKAEKPEEASEHTDDQLNKHLAANTEIPPHGTLSLSTDGCTAADRQNMCSLGGLEGRGGGGRTKVAALCMP